MNLSESSEVVYFRMLSAQVIKTLAVYVIGHHAKEEEMVAINNREFPKESNHRCVW